MGQILLGIYILISQIMALYYTWMWIKMHDFWPGVLVAPFVGEIKGLFWIFLIW